MTLQLAHRLQSPLCLLHEFRNGEITELARNLTSVQQETEVGWRDARRNLFRLLLYVVRKKPMMPGRAELREIAPGAERGKTQEHLSSAETSVLAW